MDADMRSGIKEAISNHDKRQVMTAQHTHATELMRDDEQTKRLQNKKHMLSEQKTPHNDYISFLKVRMGKSF